MPTMLDVSKNYLTAEINETWTHQLRALLYRDLSVWWGLCGEGKTIVTELLTAFVQAQFNMGIPSLAPENVSSSPDVVCDWKTKQ